MTKPTPPPATAEDSRETASADATHSQPDPIAISPAIGPLPARHFRVVQLTPPGSACSIRGAAIHPGALSVVQ
jgi:hypothetical protein